MFNFFDKLIYLKPPLFSLTYNWRLKQEKMMSIRNKNKNKNKNIINKVKILEFVSKYEKITKWMMKILPSTSNLCIFIDKNQKIEKIKYNL